jgi:hypothetical protein
MAAILPLHLPDHLHTLLISTVGFAAIHHLAAPEFAQFLVGKKAWDALGSRERVGWCVFFSISIPHLYIAVVARLVRALDCLLMGWVLPDYYYRQSRVASLVHALLVLPLAARCLYLPALTTDRAFGWDPRVGTLFAVTSG